MPGDTKIKRTAQGWIDTDVPSTYHRCRRLARDARRASRATVSTAVTGVVVPKVVVPTYTVTTPTGSSLTGLQQRLYDRLTQQQGVSAADAFDVITSHGYNAAASYGHMREAGANHSEAKIVIDLGSPAVSLAYGQRRATGYNHAWALQRALAAAGQDDDADD